MPVVDFSFMLQRHGQLLFLPDGLLVGWLCVAAVTAGCTEWESEAECVSDGIDLLQRTRQIIGTRSCIGCCTKEEDQPEEATDTSKKPCDGLLCEGRCVRFSCSITSGFGLHQADYTTQVGLDSIFEKHATAKAKTLAARSQDISMKSVAFAGSSQFAFWRRLQEDFPDHTVLNAAVSASEASHWVRSDAAVHDLLWRWNPSVVVFYCGSNDIPHEGRPVSEIADNLVEFYRKTRAMLPRAVHFVFVGLLRTPNAVLRNDVARIDELNERLFQFKSHSLDPHLDFVDTNVTWASNQKFYECDGIHLTDEGHSLLGALIQPSLPDPRL
eukprot:TRINITY_DN121255_c0_g1_i1.p1 TRINITY_DN121255_c0_g1~~TRINITY_DN121255_c0_g1_i1.p1  ORF type:complete len:327 (-),score=21.29 TRINITY_DN121255_c0_g1_i1:225-1205(-)